ncbi:MAG: ATP phosphoribosyltransferase [Desulfurella sp.]|uniref:ATP phosphoribosyltransferase n=1 Tax=Desulfurella multipotens TaxID=79269 RepID=A0A1G6PLK3_9BACT|nr:MULTISPECIES: ATP phosphoribosyltransferase [Desulfurella]AHF96489.1 ATP phosphoribosyltransferase [Desulfurella acetivorans A63]PMP63424.1 MAG: ATP phosphoribosyltransferase [Desulfurella multipotens]PMP87299.1 MAG: ATP phosphoribosyltransferase [Desulfurella sp.]SDC80929.1 ATP phosphoribosyltransferase [Desulfurella multipotens]
MKQLTIALAKGRLMDETIELFKNKGIPIDYDEKSRRLIFESSDKTFRFLIVRAQDVATYVEGNGADLGVAGIDVLIENKKDVFELMDLGIGKCSVVVAGKSPNYPDTPTQLKVATKFVNITDEFFAKKGMAIEIIKLYGSIELAGVIGLADCIVDIVSTGQTLKENGLHIIEKIMDSSAFLISNRVSYYTKNKEITNLLELLK